MERSARWPLPSENVTATGHARCEIRSKGRQEPSGSAMVSPGVDPRRRRQSARVELAVWTIACSVLYKNVIFA